MLPAQARCSYNRNKVASPKKIKNPPLSVIAVSTDESSAGLRPSLSMVRGMITPALAARTRFCVIASLSISEQQGAQRASVAIVTVGCPGYLRTSALGCVSRNLSALHPFGDDLAVLFQIW